MDPLRWQSHRLRNLFQSAALLAAMAALLGTLGWLLAGSLGVIVAGAGVAVIWVFSPAVSPKLALQMSGASALPRHAAPALLKAIAKALRMSAPNKVAVARGQEWVRSHPNCTYNTPKRKTNAPL